jgi:hypothetical protein
LRPTRLAEDRVNQICLAQTAKSVESELICDRVQVREGTCLQLGAVKY